MVDTVTIPAPNSGQTLEAAAAAQDAAAQAAAQQTPPLAGEEGNTDERPEWLPEKFKSAEDMAKAYAELEKSQSQRTPDGSQGDTEGSDDAAEQAVQQAGLNMDELSAEYSLNGELSQESLEALAAVGITQDMVEMYVAGQEATAAATTAELLEPLGGSEETYNEMIEWASDNLSDGDIDNFNTVLGTGNTAAIKLAVKNLSDQYAEANGFEPQRLLSGNPSTGGLSSYESTAQLMKDMQNPAYATDPAFRDKVAEKLARSSIM